MTKEEFQSKGAAYKMVMILDALDKGIDLTDYNLEEDIVDTEDTDYEVVEEE